MAESDFLIRLTSDPLILDEATSFVTLPSCGGISVFLGTTRDNFDGKSVAHLEYEAYKPMAVKEIEKICQQMKEKWDIKRVSVLHRLGHVPVTEASVIIAASSPHRKDAMKAVQYGIDTLKATIPIWKKERYTDGTCSWKENKECDWTTNEKKA